MLGAGDVADRELLGLAHVHDDHAVAKMLGDDRGVDLFDLALDLAEQLRSGRAHSGKLLKRGRLS